MQHKIIQTINQSSLFYSLTQKEKEAMADYGKLLEFKEGEVIFKMGSSNCDFFYIIHSGIIGLYLKTGRKKTYYSGDIFGEVGIFNKSFRSGTIRAKTDALSAAIHRDFLFNNEGSVLTAAKVHNILTSQIISYLQEVQDEPAANIIARGETDKVEFKSSYNENTQKSILKTIVGFLNHKGGIIFIGVKDINNEVVGVHETDKQIDAIRVNLMKEITNRVGASYATLVKCSSEYVQKRKVIKIICLSSTEPVFLKYLNGSDTLEEEHFYVRQDANTRRLPNERAIVDYVFKRFVIQ